jgi:ligand-binding sensor domain-containing protein/DNA-binding CsgD family transcriptional regulator
MLFFANTLFAQNSIGLPKIVNYTNEDIQASFHTWDIKQDANGIMYFANDDGLLTYNGSYWNLLPLKNKSNVRSLEIFDGKVFTGGQDEIGYFAPDNSGKLSYTSLKSLIPIHKRQFADIWDIVSYHNHIFFRAADVIFMYSNKTITVFPASSEWRYMNVVNDHLYAQDRHLGLMEYKNGKWVVVDDSFGKCSDKLITGILGMADGNLLITTFKHGIYKMGTSTEALTTSDAQNISNNYIYCSTKINDHEFALGTVTGGCYIMNDHMQITDHFSHYEGIQNDNILCVFRDNHQNIWLGTDNGIDFVSYNSAIRTIYPDNNNRSGVYAVRIFEDKLFVGTSNGLYSTPTNDQYKDLSYLKTAFTPVENTRGQVWNLDEVNQQLLMGHHEGTFVVKNNAAVSLASGHGSWLFLPVFYNNPVKNIVVGSYNGVEMLQFENGSFKFKNNITGVTESLRFLVQDNDGVIWASHPYRGIYRLKLKDDGTAADVKLYSSTNGLFPATGPYIFKIKGKIVAASDKGLFEYDATKDRFTASPLLKGVFDSVQVQYLKEDEDGNIWFVSGHRMGVVDYNLHSDKKEYTVIYFPEVTDKFLREFENIYVYNRENIFIGGSRGVIHINYSKYLTNIIPVQAKITKVRASNKADSVIYGGYAAIRKDLKPEMKSSWKNFHFEFASSLYDQREDIEYSYMLEGFEREWSKWSHKTEKDYTNLSPGSYTFKVKARNNLGKESAAVSYTFTILPPWYQSVWASVLYVIVLLYAGNFLYRRHKKKLDAQHIAYEIKQKQLQYLHNLELDKNEKEIMKLQNEKLETEVEFKNKELASATMHLVQRGKLLTKIKDDLATIQRTSKETATISSLRDLLFLLNGSEKNDEHWNQFSMHFDQVHSNYLGNLKGTYPQLTSTDLKLCAYLKMNLASKEIAQLLCISVRGVEISRYRLRKKLGIAKEVNLYDFLSAYG